MNYTRKKRRAKRSDIATFYINRHPQCESCYCPSEEVHHIISVKTQGPDEDWNFLALCRGCHAAFHLQGRRTWAEGHPALRGKIVDACERMGRKYGE